MEFNLLGPSLVNKFSLSMLANQLLYRLQYIHSKNFIQTAELLDGCEVAWKSALSRRFEPVSTGTLLRLGEGQ